MQDKHTDLHFMMVAALVLVAASAIFQTAIGLGADNLSAAQSQRMFATVVAASGSTVNPKVEQYAKQMRSVEINDNGRAKVRGIVKSVASRGLSVQSWGGEWKVIVSSATKITGQRGKLEVGAIKEGDYVFVDGIAENSGNPVISAQVIADYTLYRAPVGTEAAKRAVTPDMPIVAPAMPLPQAPAVPGSAPTKVAPPPEMNVSAAQNLNVAPAGVNEVNMTGGVERLKAPLQKSME
jgi:hypothetical protein